MVGEGKRVREREKETMENTWQRVALLAVHNEVRSIGKVSIYCFSLDLENIVNNKGEVGECNKFVSRFIIVFLLSVILIFLKTCEIKWERLSRNGFTWKYVRYTSCDNVFWHSFWRFFFNLFLSVNILGKFGVL